MLERFNEEKNTLMGKKYSQIHSGSETYLFFMHEPYEHELSIIIGNARVSPINKLKDHSYNVENRYVKIVVGDDVIENNFMLLNELASAIKFYERRGWQKVGIQALALDLIDYIPNCGSYPRSRLRIRSFDNKGIYTRSPGIYLVRTDDDDDRFFKEWSFAKHRLYELQYALIKAMNWLSPEQAVFEERY